MWLALILRIQIIGGRLLWVHVRVVRGTRADGTYFRHRAPFDATMTPNANSIIFDHRCVETQILLNFFAQICALWSAAAIVPECKRHLPKTRPQPNLRAG